MIQELNKKIHEAEYFIKSEDRSRRRRFDDDE